MDDYDPGARGREVDEETGSSKDCARYQVFDLGALLGKLPGRLGPWMQ